MSLSTNQTPVITAIYACSDMGNVRTNNEDNFVIADLISGRCCSGPQSMERELAENRLLLAVSDGMGGAQAGEIASALAVYGLRLELLRQAANNGLHDDIAEWLVQALEKINELIWHGGQQVPEYKGMGAAITAVLIDGARAFVAEVGDSRAYIIRRNKIKQITTDQSLFEALIQSGAFKGEQLAEHAPARSIILQSLGGQQTVKVAVSVVGLRAGDHLLLCSDGLSNKLSAEEMRKLVAKSPNLEAACTAMMSMAKKRGGEDNITIVLARFEGDGLPQASEQGSITKSIDVISSYDPLGEENKRRRQRYTQQMVSDRQLENPDDEYDQPIFRSTIGLLPLAEYPERTAALTASDRSVELLEEAGKQIGEVIEQLHKLELWVQKQGRLDPQIQKGVAHLEHAIKNVQKIEMVARKARNLVDRLSAKPEK